MTLFAGYGTKSLEVEVHPATGLTYLTAHEGSKSIVITLTPDEFDRLAAIGFSRRGHDSTEITRY